MAPCSRGRVLATIKSLLSFANKAGYLPFDVGAAVELPKVEDAVSERILSGALLPAKLQLCITGFGSPEL